MKPSVLNEIKIDFIKKLNRIKYALLPFLILQMLNKHNNIFISFHFIFHFINNKFNVQYKLSV